MKRIRTLISASMAVVFLLTGCGALPWFSAPAAPSAVPAGGGGPVVPASEVPALPIDLSGPPAGTPMIWIDGSILIHVPGGEFIMGGEGTDNPVHKVGVSSFWIYRTKVTNRMFTYCVAAGQCDPPKDSNSLKDFSDPNLRDFPVAGVDWQQADTYCKFVEGRLPTEAEWEKTARGPEGNVYPWGDSEPACSVLNFNGVCVGKKTKVFDYPTGKSYYTGLDLAGNAFEWNGDWYDPNYYSTAPVADPIGPELGTVRTVRGSSYQSDSTQIPSYRRFFLDPAQYRPDLGFRCVVEDPHPFAPFCQQIFVPGKIGNEPLGGQLPDPGSCETPNVSFSEKCGTGDGQVTGATIDSIDPGSATITCGNSTSNFTCTGSGSANVKVCAKCDNPQYPPGGQCGPGEYFDGQSCVSPGQPGQCPTGYTYLAAQQCCSAGPGIPVAGCASDEELQNGQCVKGTPKTPGCTYVQVNLDQQCCRLTAASCKTNEVFNKDACQCEPKSTCPITADQCKSNLSTQCPYGVLYDGQACTCECAPPPSTRP